jgi:hypothetical protein
MAGSRAMAAATKLQPTDRDVEAFLQGIPNEERRSDARRLVAALSDLMEAPPVLWTAGIIGFAEYRYRYATGREGVAPLAGFSPRKDNLVVYLIADFEERHETLLAQLGPHRSGKSCLYVKRLSDVDVDVLVRLIARSADARRGMDIGA